MSDQKQTQSDQIIEFIKTHGSITTAEAFYQLGCSRLSGRIFDLEKRGYLFDRTSEKVVTRTGKTATIVRYSLADEKDLA